MFWFEWLHKTAAIRGEFLFLFSKEPNQQSLCGERSAREYLSYRTHQKVRCLLKAKQIRRDFTHRVNNQRSEPPTSEQRSAAERPPHTDRAWLALITSICRGRRNYSHRPGELALGPVIWRRSFSSSTSPKSF